jgi:type IV pilus assembly protein PilE
MRKAMNKKNKQLGFTLIELMITVAILGILSSIAVPSYMTYVTKSKRTEAKTEILRLAQLQESHYIQNLTYAKSHSDGLGFPAGTLYSETELYTITAIGQPAACLGTSASPCTGYEIKAVPNTSKAQANDKKCTGFSILNTGRKGASGNSITTYYNADNIKECWG